jgi:hypothetical protein
MYEFQLPLDGHFAVAIGTWPVPSYGDAAPTSKMPVTLEEQEKSGFTLPQEIVLKMRQERSAPVMAAFSDWIDKLLPGVPPTSALGSTRQAALKKHRLPFPGSLKHVLKKTGRQGASTKSFTECLRSR